VSTAGPGRHAGGRRRGFTLIEVLVALAVVGLALGAALSVTGSSIRSHEHARLNTLASWVAMELRAELLLANARPAFLGEDVVERRQWGQRFLAEVEGPAQEEGEDRVWSEYAIRVWPADAPAFAPVALTAVREPFE